MMYNVNQIHKSTKGADIMRTIAIGDVHGCYEELKVLMHNLLKEKVYNPKTDKLVFLGDYIDRGDNPKKVVKYIRNLQKDNENVIAIMGNHEDMLLEWFNGDKDSGWLWNGYEHTIESYQDKDERFLDEDFLDDIIWMNNLPLYYEDDYFVYVHAGINPNFPMEKQSRYTLLWTRNEFIYNRKKYHKQVIFGHTPDLHNPYYTTNGQNVCIDTGCVFGGYLTALVIDNDTVKQYYKVKKGERIMEKKSIRIMAQAFYGNNVYTDIDVKNVDRFILGYTGNNLEVVEKIDRTIVNVPNTDNLVIVYNKYQEAEEVNGKGKPLAEIPEIGLKLYSRCIACRINDKGELISLEPEDSAIIKNYFAA